MPLDNRSSYSQEPQQIQKSYSPNYSYPNQIQDANMQAVASLTKLLLESSSTLSILRREFRGEALHQSEEGNSTWIQVVKPILLELILKQNLQYLKK